MIAFIEATVLTIGLERKSQALRKLPIELLIVQSGFEAARSLKTKEIDSVICRWDLEDMHNGEFLRRLKAVKPNVPTIALISSGDMAQEIAARSLGVSAVLTDDIDNDYFVEIVSNALNLDSRFGYVTAESNA